MEPFWGPFWGPFFGPTQPTKSPKIDNFGTHFRGTNMGQFSDLKNGPTQPKKSHYIAYVSPQEALLVPPIRK